MKYWIFYHRADMDGCASAYLIHRYFKQRLEGNDTCVKIETLPIEDGNTRFEYIPYNYNDNVDKTITKFKRGDYVIFADCLLYQKETQPTVIDIAKIVGEGHVSVFDHHATAIEWINDHIDDIRENDIRCCCAKGFGACELVQSALFPNTLRDANPFMAITLISKHDVWNNANKEECETKVVPFMHYLKYCVSIDLADINSIVELFDRLCDRPDDILTDTNDRNIVEACITEGKLARNIIRNRNLSIWRTTGFVSHVDFQTVGVSCLAAICSDYLQNSTVFEDAIEAGLLDSTGIDMFILLRYEFKNQKHEPNNPWMHPAYGITIYSKNEAYDGGKICASLGGGGHVGAAGGYPKCIEIREFKRSDPSMPRDYLTIIGNAPVVWSAEELEQFVVKK